MIDRRTLLALAGLGLLPKMANAGADPCGPYYGKGYCTDYVNSRIGRHISGEARDWPSNVPPAYVQPGDVAVFRSIDHVALVEQIVQRDDQGKPVRISLSEMNFGARRPDAPRECIVTNNFGVVTRGRIVAVSSAEYFRQSGFSPPNIRFTPPTLPATPDNRVNGSTPSRSRR